MDCSKRNDTHPRFASEDLKWINWRDFPQDALTLWRKNVSALQMEKRDLLEMLPVLSEIPHRCNSILHP
jgi:hypothetical protein